MTSASTPETFPLKEARRLVKDLQAPKPATYWFDFLFSNFLGWAAVGYATVAEAMSAPQIAALIVAALALYRAVLFIHELSHLKRGTFKLFRFVWNMLCGLPLMVPSFTYAGVHIDHHKPQIYGTKEDGEYLPIGIENPWKLPLYLLTSLVVGPLFAFRFIVLTPLTHLHPKLRQLVWRYFSSLTVDMTYERPESTKNNDRTWYAQELGAFAYGVAALTAVYLGYLPAKLLIVWYIVVAIVFVLNTVRTLVAHAYKNPGDTSMGRSQEFFDSIDIPGNNFITPLWAPVGLRFHATHHLFPYMPYHNLPEANRRLTTQLEDNTPYLVAHRKGLIDGLWRLWRDAKAYQQAEKLEAKALRAKN
ncbi:MAG: fatty acid desaturase [Kordiimonadaceae bacterium]|nr:fatty acid desaturase [Kordiimonadaceae bacterium]